MEDREVSVFLRCLAAAGVREAKVSGTVFHSLWRNMAQHCVGYDKEGQYIDAGPTRIRPIYKRDAEIFGDDNEITEFVKRVFREL